MQVRELAAQEWADAEHLPAFAHEQCFDPGTNTLAGTWYLRKLLRRYAQADNPVPYALADYNAGRGNVLKWIGGAAATNSAAFIEHIGFPGTKDYVKAVMRRYARYRPLFPPDGP
jgi:soluble lytic murein transglycosylase